ncbi:MAG: hypothetical protein ACI4NA_06330, partial [Succinivibrio sp.]
MVIMVASHKNGVSYIEYRQPGALDAMPAARSGQKPAPKIFTGRIRSRSPPAMADGAMACPCRLKVN